MTQLKRSLFWGWVVFFGALCGPVLSVAASGLKVKMLLTAIELPAGFTISVYAENVPGARSLALGPSGVLFVGTRQLGRVYAVVDRDHDMRADGVITIADAAAPAPILSASGSRIEPRRLCQP